MLKDINISNESYINDIPIKVGMSLYIKINSKVVSLKFDTVMHIYDDGIDIISYVFKNDEYSYTFNIDCSKHKIIDTYNAKTGIIIDHHYDNYDEYPNDLKLKKSTDKIIDSLSDYIDLEEYHTFMSFSCIIENFCIQTLITKIHEKRIYDKIEDVYTII